MLSIVSIGKNEAENIPRLAASIEALKQLCDFPIETLFIDSASSDQSGETAAAIRHTAFPDRLQLLSMCF